MSSQFWPNQAAHGLAPNVSPFVRRRATPQITGTSRCPGGAERAHEVAERREGDVAGLLERQVDAVQGARVAARGGEVQDVA